MSKINRFISICSFYNLFNIRTDSRLNKKITSIIFNNINLRFIYEYDVIIKYIIFEREQGLLNFINELDVEEEFWNYINVFNPKFNIQVNKLLIEYL